MRRRTFLASGLALTATPGCSPEPPAALSRAPVVGLEPALTARTLEAAASLPRLHSVIAARNGKVEAERVFRGSPLDVAINIKSASKSVLAAITGIAIGKGVLTGPDQLISTVLADRFPPDPDPRLAKVTVGHLLSMQAGLGSTSGANYGAWVSSPDWVRSALARPFEAEPGGRMIYSTGTSHLLSALLTRAAGRSTLQLAREWLGQPLGIDIPAWPADPQGIYFGGNDMRLSPRSLVKFGELYRNDGVHDGLRILPEGWVDASWRGRGASRWSGRPYGLGWWIRRWGGYDVFFAWGYGGQMVFIVPKLSLTVVMTSDPSPVAERDDHVPSLHRLLDTGFIPAAERGDPRRTPGGATGPDDN